MVEKGALVEGCKYATVLRHDADLTAVLLYLCSGGHLPSSEEPCCMY